MLTDAKVGIHNGVDGLVGGEVKDIAWADVDGWIGQVTFTLTQQFTFTGEDGQKASR